jgi:hypothetical protein
LENSVNDVVDWVFKFKRDLLGKSEVGQYVLNLQESVNKMDKNRYNSVIDQAVQKYKANTQVDFESTALAILKTLISNGDSSPKNDNLSVLYDEHKAAMADHNSRDA